MAIPRYGEGVDQGATHKGFEIDGVITVIISDGGGLMAPGELVVESIRASWLQAYLIGAAIVLSPLIAFGLTLYLQYMLKRHADKMEIFKTLMGQRAHPIVAESAVTALNTIDVIFANSPKVVSAWRAWRLGRIQNPPPLNLGHLWIELLTAMAEDCGYRSISQTTLDAAYNPQWIADLDFQKLEIAKELARVLKNIPDPQGNQGQQNAQPAQDTSHL